MFLHRHVHRILTVITAKRGAFLPSAGVAGGWNEMNAMCALDRDEIRVQPWPQVKATSDERGVVKAAFISDEVPQAAFKRFCAPCTHSVNT
jgi:hypothetical protein